MSITMHLRSHWCHRLLSTLPLLASLKYDQHMTVPRPALSIEMTHALDQLLPNQDRHEDVIIDLCLAAREALRRREANSRDGGIVITALHAYGLSWHQIEVRTGIPTRTARRWADPTPGVMNKAHKTDKIDKI